MHVDSTPWGMPQSQREIAPGIVEVATASHGGFVLDKMRAEELGQHLPDYAARIGPHAYLEEDCDWSAAVVVWPDEFPPEAVAYAVGCFRRWCSAPAGFWEGHGARAAAIAEANKVA
jgi:hypothetical protein